MASIREALPGDAGRLTELIRAAFSDVSGLLGITIENCPGYAAFTEEARQREAFEKGIRFFLLEDEAGEAGCVAWDPRNPAEPWLARLAVLPRARHRGYGRMLVEHVMALAREDGFEYLLIGVVATNRRLVEWYHRLGFRDVESLKYDHLPFEVLRMRRDLA